MRWAPSAPRQLRSKPMVRRTRTSWRLRWRSHSVSSSPARVSSISRISPIRREHTRRRRYRRAAMARDWRNLFVMNEPAPEAAPAGEEPAERGGFFRRLRENLGKTRRALAAEVQATLLEGDLDEAAWERLEEALIYADVGARTTAQVVERLEQEATADGLDGEALTERLVELLAQSARTGD